MRFVQISNDDEIRILRLSRPKANALNGDIVEELIHAIQESSVDAGVRGIVFASAQPRFFSAGFDTREVFKYDEPAMHRFFGRFISLYENISRLPKPVVGAITGHAFGGGAFLALAFDFRIFSRGDYGFALNEISFGAMVPPGVQRMLLNAIGQREAKRVILTGEIISAVRALNIGLADDVVSKNDVLPTATRIARSLAEKPPKAFAINKRALRRSLSHVEPVSDMESCDDFIKQWFSSECVALREALARSLSTQID